MSVELIVVKESGDLEKERLVLRAVREGDIGKYLVTRAKIGGMPDRKVLAGSTYFAYWFPEKIVNEGDLVILYSKSGKSSERVNFNDTKSYFYYAGRDKSIWNQPDTVPILMEVGSWSTLAFEADTEA